MTGHAYHLNRILLLVWLLVLPLCAASGQGILSGVLDADTVPPFQIGAMPDALDTIPVVYYGSFTIASVIRSADEENAIRKLKQNVIKVYPYAQRALAMLREIEDVSGSLDKRRDKKKYIKQLEEEMRQEFEQEIKKMYRSDGRVLIKIIERETGKTFYDIVKDTKSPFTAWTFQLVGKRYGYDLKQGYNPKEEKNLETILQQVETLGLQSLDPKAKIDTATIYNSSQAAKKALEKKKK